MTDVVPFPSSGETIIIGDGWYTDLDPSGPRKWVYFLLVRQDDDDVCDHVDTYDTYEEARAEALEWASERGCRIENRLQIESGEGA